MPADVATKEIESTTDIIYKTTGVKTNLFRPPGGHLHNGLVDYAKNHGYVTVMWSEDTRDFSQPPVSQIVHRGTKTVNNGSIILMHDAGGKRHRTLEALPQIISNLKAKSYEFVTLPELLKD
jgi:chitin deacetylase